LWTLNYNDAQVEKVVELGVKDGKETTNANNEHYMEFLALKKKKDPSVYALKFEAFVEAKEEGVLQVFDYVKDEYLKAIYLQ
jgi:hypothetical protein